MDEPIKHPVRLGTMLFTLVEPHPGHEVAYNRWYERDHFYAGCMAGPYQLAGARFVATRAEKQRRPRLGGALVDDQMRGSYLALYWILDGCHDAWNAWAVEQVHHLHAQGRMFAAREHVHTKLYRHEATVARDRDPVPAELALDHRFPGLVAIVGEAHDAAARDRLLAALRTRHVPELIDASPAALCLTFTPLPLREDAPADVPRDQADALRFCQLWFCDDPARDPVDRLVAQLREAVASTSLGRLVFASPFRPTVPGTDTDADDLR